MGGRLAGSMARRVLPVLSGVLGAALLSIGLSACSSNQPAASTGTQAGQPPLTKSTLLFGSVDNITGGPTVDTQTEPTIHAWQSWVNSHGGINGHPVKVIVEDDKSDPALATSEVETMVQTDHVLAMVNVQDSSTETAWANYVLQHKIPVIGGDGYTTAWFTNPMFFPAATTVLSILYGQMDAAKRAGAKNFAYMYDSSSPAAAQAANLFKQLGNTAGIPFVTSIGISANAANFTAPCLAAKNAGAQSIEDAAPNVATIINQCAQQGYKPVWVISAGSNVASLLSVRPEITSVGNTNCFPWFVHNNVTKEYHEAMAKYAPNPDATGCTSALSWSALKMTQKVGAELPAHPTSQDVLNALWQVKNETLGGLSPPLTYVKDTPMQVKCYYLMGIKNGHFYTNTGFQTFCQP